MKVVSLSGVEDVGVLAEDLRKREITRKRGLQGGLTAKLVLDNMKAQLLSTLPSSKQMSQWIYGNFEFSNLAEQFASLRPKVYHLFDHTPTANCAFTQILCPCVVANGRLFCVCNAAGASDGATTLSVENLTSLVAKVFGVDASKVDSSAPLTQLGLDSLMAVELSATLKKAFNIKLTQMELLGGMSILKIYQKATA